MKLLTRDTDYGIRALIFMNTQNGRVVPAGELVDALRIPRPFLRKILQKLNKNGILKSYKGQGGGFSASVDIGKLALKDLIEIFQGPITLNECTFKKKACLSRYVCPLKKRIDNIEKEMVSQLKNIRIKDLLKSPGE